MKIEYQRHNQINCEKWDVAISHAHNRLVYAFSWYLDIVSPGWEALATPGYELVMPLTKSSKYGISYLAQPLLTQQLGVFSKEVITQQQVQEFLSAIPKKMLYININLNAANTLPLQNKLQVTQRKNYLLPLNKTYEEIFNSYHKYRRKNVRKSAQAGFELRESLAAKDLVEFFCRHLRQKIGSVKHRHYLLLQHLLETLIQRKKLYKKEAWLNGELMGTLAVALDEPHCIYLHGAASPKGKELYVTEFLIDHFIQQHAGLQLVFDFEGSMIPGIAYFYKSFGADESLYLQVQGKQIPLLWKWGRK